MELIDECFFLFFCHFEVCFNWLRSLLFRVLQTGYAECPPAKSIQLGTAIQVNCCKPPYKQSRVNFVSITAKGKVALHEKLNVLDMALKNEKNIFGKTVFRTLDLELSRRRENSALDCLTTTARSKIRILYINFICPSFSCIKKKCHFICQ